MDIDLLSKMVRETILDHDAVTLPGIGSFMAEIVPSQFSDKGYTIHPPYRRLYFSRREEGDSLLSDLYAASNGIPDASAQRIVAEFLSELKEVLKEKKTVVFPGLGRLRATRENNFFFVADEDLDIYPAGFGLKPVSLKTHQETEEEVAEAVAGLASILLDDEPGAASPVAAELVATGPAQTEPVAVEPAAAEPIATEPVAAEAAMREPAQTEPIAAEPVATEPVAAEPALAEPAETEPVTAKTVAAEPAETEPVAAEPVAAESVETEPVAAEPALTEPAATEASPAKQAPAPAAPAKPAPAEPVDPWEGIRNVERKPVRLGKRLLVVLGVLLAVVLVLLIAYMVLSRVAPQWVDRFLYSAEDLELVRQAF